MDKLFTEENIQEILYLYLIEFHESADLCMELAKRSAHKVWLRYLDVTRIEIENILRREEN